ncbi:MAG: hypothetical protein Q9160_003449 [Pyrenula sp. 1 TL-2023]
MEMNNHIEPPFQVVIPPQRETREQSSVSKRGLLTVDEALKFSPIASSTSFGLECLPLPQIGHGNSTTPLTSLSARHKSYQSLNEHTSRLQRHPTDSLPLQTIAQEVKQLLDQGSLTEFQFNSPCPLPDSSNVEPTLRAGRTNFKKQLSPFANPSPSTPSSRSQKCQRLLTPAPSHTSGKTPNATNQATHGYNGNVTPQSNKKPKVLIPSLPASSQQDYVTVPASPREDKPRMPLADGDTALKIQAQKDEADAVLLRFQDFLHEIFEAEDNLEPDTSMTAQPAKNDLFAPMGYGSEHYSLTTRTHSVIQKSLKKLVEFSRLHDIPDDYLQRLQRICERTIFTTKDLDMRNDDLLHGNENASWEAKLRVAENGVASSCTFVWTVLGSISKKELCPEDVVQCLPSILESTIEDCLIPIVEARPNGRDAELFHGALAAKPLLTRLASQCRRFLDLLVRICLQMDGLTGVVAKLEFLAAKLIFVENAHAEKDSALGFQVYEAIRRSAMDGLARLFSRYEADREDILFQISQNLEKLPTTKQSARQFKLPDGQNIQLLSALLMLLVQTTSLEMPQRLSKSRSKRGPTRLEADELDSENEESTYQGDGDDDSDDEDHTLSKISLVTLRSRINAMNSNAMHSAQFIVNFFLEKATMPKATKTGEEPYRNLLDLFVQDLVSVLPSTDWPAAELLLRILTAHMVKFSGDNKASASVKNMALELLSWFGAAISKLRITLQQALSQKEENADDCGRYLLGLADDHLMGALQVEDIVTENGPFRIAVEYLQDRDVDNFQIRSAKTYFLVQWGYTFIKYIPEEEDADLDAETSQLASFINNAITEPRWLESNSDFESVATSQGRLAYLITVLNSDFGKTLDRIMRILLHSISSDQAKTRSRSLKSVVTMLETDPKLLDRDPMIMRVIFRCASDSSPMVRDSALSLIGKCMALKPALEEEGSNVILKCLTDSAPGVRKRCMGILKEIYSRGSKRPLRITIIESFLLRVKDQEESVSSLARQMIEELLFSPLVATLHLTGDSAQSKVAITEQTNLLIENFQQNEEVFPFFETFLRHFLSDSSKQAASNFHVCKALVTEIFYRIANSSGHNSDSSQVALLKSLTAFAKVKSHLIVPDQLQTLQPYISNLATGEDLFLFRSVVVIYRCTLPHLSGAQKPMLVDIQNDLFRSISRLARAELNEVMACLWTIDGVLKNTERLIKLTVSALRGIRSLKGSTFSENAASTEASRIKAYIRIVGCVGNNCDFESHSAHFKQAFSSWQVVSVAGLLADSICPFALRDQPLWLRTIAMESLGSICQSWPAQFNKEHIRSTLSDVFQYSEAELQNIVLKTFAEFFGIREDSTETFPTKSEASQGEGLGRLGGSLQASEHDSAASLIAQHFLKAVLEIAISRLDSYGLIATQVIASINRQGLVHPKECAAALVALETAPVPQIAKIAYETHSLLHHQHESMFEREYMRAIHGAFLYQKTLIKDPMGATTRPFAAKLGSLYELVKTSNAKYVRKFLSNLVSRVNFELSSLDISADTPEHVLFTRFTAQNVAFFEYGKIDELLSAISCIEAVVGKTGADIAQAIETQILGVTFAHTELDGQTQAQNGETEQRNETKPPIDLLTLRRLTAAAMALSILWEVRVHLKRQYSPCLDLRRDGKGKDSKELAKGPTKAHGINGDRFWENVSMIMASLESNEKMLARCQEFATLMNIDDEVRVAAENDELREDYSVSVDPEDDVPRTSDGRPGMKRKMSASIGGTPKKKRGRPSLKDRRKSETGDSDGEWD